jgi:maltooligosyltrehalose trehalohydrolase
MEGRIQLWAPEARTVSIEIAGRTLPLREAGAGWWQIQTHLASHGTDYGIRLDHGPILPDPRSGWQPYGSGGASRIIDHSRFQWNDSGFQAGPLSAAIIYELHIGTFSPEGSFAGAAARLDHLAKLGATHVELMPVNGFPGRRGWGYDGVNLFAPHEAYGGPDGLKGLVDRCHGQGLAVLLDVVYNHLGPEDNFLARFGPYFTERYSTPWGKAVNLDGPESDEVRRFFIDNARMWLEHYHADGLRIDAIHGLIDASALHFLEQLATEVEALQASLGRRLTLIAESDLNDPRCVRPRQCGGYGLDAQWNDDFHHALHALLSGESRGYYEDFGSYDDLAKALTSAFVYDGRYSRHRRRSHGRPATGLSGHRFVTFLQNHDQVGNRAQGERASHLMSSGRQKIGACLLLTSPFVPLLFQGEEWAASTPFLYFTDHQGPEQAKAVREGRVKEFSSFQWKPDDIPDPQAEQTFVRSRLDWEEPSQEPHRSMLEWYGKLIGIRKRMPSLTDGDMEKVKVRHDATKQWIVVERYPVLCACNLASGPQWVEVGHRGRHGRLLAASEEPLGWREGGIRLQAESAALVHFGD